MGGGKDDILSVLQRQPHISRSALHMEITPEASSRNLQIWQCALMKWKDVLAWGRRNGACNIVYTDEKTYVERGCKGIVSDVVQMWASSVRDNFSLPNRWPIPVFKAVLSMPSHITLVCFVCLHGQETQSTPHLPSAVSLPPLFSQAQRSRETARYVTHLIAWEHICAWLLCGKCNEMTICTFPHACRSNESLASCSEVFSVSFSFSQIHAKLRGQDLKLVN